MVCARPTACLLVLLAWAGSARTAHAFECKRSDKYDWISLRWSERVIPYGIRAGANVEVSHIETAFGTWSSNNCTDIEFQYVGIVDEAAGGNQVVFIREGWSSPVGRDPRPLDAVAVTLTTFARDDGEIRSAVIEVNEERFSFAEVTEACQSDELEVYDLIAVVTHEVGHFIGLDHTTFFNGMPGDPTMAPMVGECEADKRTLEADDIEGLCQIYPRDQPARSCMPLPSQATYVANRPFGCTAAPHPRGSPFGVVLLVLLFSRVLRGRGTRQNLR